MVDVCCNVYHDWSCLSQGVSWLELLVIRGHDKGLFVRGCVMIGDCYKMYRDWSCLSQGRNCLSQGVSWSEYFASRCVMRIACHECHDKRVVCLRVCHDRCLLQGVS